MADEAFLEATYNARERYAHRLGEVNPDFIAPLLNPSFMGGPMWPNLRQAWYVIRRDNDILCMSDGLSDPFEDDSAPNAGLGLEVLVQSGDRLPDPLQASWLFNLVFQVSQQCAGFGNWRELIDELGLLSLELRSAPSEGQVGVLLGVSPPDFSTDYELPGGSVKVVTAKLLWPSELAYAASHGGAGRRELADRFAADGTHHRSSLLRPPVV